MLKVRNLGSHNSDSIWGKLDNGMFDQGAFPGIKTWKQVWGFIEDQILNLLHFLNNNGKILSDDELKIKENELNTLENL